MLKRDEVVQPSSCLNRARDDEMIFVLLERDEDAPETIREWVRRRIKRGKNQAGDAQMTNALQVADQMEESQKCSSQLPRPR